MAVIPGDANILSNDQELDKLLVACQEKSAQIVSFSQEIDPIDPLVIFRQIAQPNELYFYWENPQQQEAFFGYGTTKYLTIESPDRFTQAQKFINNCWQQTMRIGDSHLLFAGPRLFSSFTFFSDPPHHSPFPPATIFLPRLMVVNQKNQCVLTINQKLTKSANLKLIIAEIKKQIQAITFSNGRGITEKHPIKLQDLTCHNFTSAVVEALKSIDSKEFSKIVLATAKDVISPRPYSIVESLNNLRQLHPDCYIFSISNGKGFNFMGASPERLIKIQNQQLVTDALAGSAPRGKTPTEDNKFAQELLNSEKERREHQAVSEFITQRLNQLGITPQGISSHNLKLLKLSNIQHLWTPIYAQIPANVHPLDLVAQLHPTPAVAGVPTEIACQQIRRYENFDRSLYAAPLGWLDHQGNGEFIVGIRSALIKDNHARLYAGAGIVAGSDPNKELAEIQLKLQALLQALL